VVQPRAGGDLGDGVLAAGPVDAAGAAAVDELQRGDLRDRPDETMREIVRVLRK